MYFWCCVTWTSPAADSYTCLQESLKNNHQEILFSCVPLMMFLYTEPRQKPIRSIPFVTLLSIVRKLTLMVESSRIHFTLSWSFKFPRPNFVGFSSNPLSLLIAFHAVGNTVGNSRISLLSRYLYDGVWCGFLLFPWYTESRNFVPFFFRVWKTLETLGVCVSHVLVFNKKELVSFSHRQDLVRLAWYIRG